MKKSCKFLFLICFLITAILLDPLSVVRADETSGETNDRNNRIPYINLSEIKFEKKDFFDWFGLKDKPEETCIEEFVLAHRKLSNIDYSLYDLVCDFELKTKNNSDVVTTSKYSYTIDFSEYERGFFDNLLVQLDLKEDYYEHIFNYYEIVKNADGFDKRDITGKDKYFTYNTVISQADFYFVSKSDGEKGRVRRYKFTWDSNFWLQKCTKIDFSWYDQETEIEKEIGTVESETGVDGYSTNTKDSYLGLDVSVWDGILGFFTDLPAAIIAFISGFMNLIDSLKELLLVVFPFVPAGIVSVLMLMILFILVVALYKLVQGWFG